MIVIDVRTDLAKLTAQLSDLQRTQIPFATARALNDAAAASADAVNAAMPTIFGKATAFTRRAAVAPKSKGALKSNLAALVTIRDIQAKYLLHEEVGGTRTPADNTRNPSARALVLPGAALPLNAYRNIPRGALAKLRALAGQKSAPGKGVAFLPATAKGNKAGIGGYFIRAGASLRRLTAFKPNTSYTPKFRFAAHVEAAARPAFAAAWPRRLAEALATMRK